MSEVDIPLHERVSEPDVTVILSQSKDHAKDGALDGRFLRIGGLVLLAPDLGGDENHIDLFMAARDNPVNSQLAIRTREAWLSTRNLDGSKPEDGYEVIDTRFGITDAGRYDFLTYSRTLEIFGQSLQFGRANEAGRFETVRLTIEAIGHSITVVETSL